MRQVLLHCNYMSYIVYTVSWEYCWDMLLKGTCQIINTVERYQNSWWVLCYSLYHNSYNTIRSFAGISVWHNPNYPLNRLFGYFYRLLLYEHTVGDKIYFPLPTQKVILKSLQSRYKAAKQVPRTSDFPHKSPTTLRKVAVTGNFLNVQLFIIARFGETTPNPLNQLGFHPLCRWN